MLNNFLTVCRAHLRPGQCRQREEFLAVTTLPRGAGQRGRPRHESLQIWTKHTRLPSPPQLWPGLGGARPGTFASILQLPLPVQVGPRPPCQPESREENLHAFRLEKFLQCFCEWPGPGRGCVCRCEASSGGNDRTQHISAHVLSIKYQQRVFFVFLEENSRFVLSFLVLFGIL